MGETDRGGTRSCSDRGTMLSKSLIQFSVDGWGCAPSLSFNVTTLMAESHKELKRLLMKVKEEKRKFGLKLNIQKTKIMASGPITLWEIDGETMETVRFHFLGSKINADSDCSHEIKRCLFLGRKAMTNLDSILKSRDITLVSARLLDYKGPSSQSYGFSSSHA